MKIKDKEQKDPRVLLKMQVTFAVMMSAIAWYRLSPDDSWVYQDNNPFYIFIALVLLLGYGLRLMAIYSRSLFWGYILNMIAVFVAVAVTLLGSLYLLSVLVDRMGNEFTDSGWFIFFGLLTLFLPAIVAVAIVFMVPNRKKGE